MAELKFTVPAECDGQKLEDFLKKEYNVSGTTLKKAKKIENGITMDKIHTRTVDKVRGGSTIIILTEDEFCNYTECSIPVPVIYEDSAVIVFNKPADMPCHPSKGHPYNTVADVFFTNPSTKGLTFRCTGRLDSNTSGIVPCAKHAYACPSLVKDSRKEYLGIVEGNLPYDFIIEAPIERKEELNPRRCVKADGKYSATKCTSILAGEKYSLVALSLFTGRTHQIRTHLSFLGHPLAGDELYGGSREDIKRHALHCYRMILNGSDGKEKDLRAPIPLDMQEVLEKYFCKEQLKCLDKLFL